MNLTISRETPRIWPNHIYIDFLSHECVPAKKSRAEFDSLWSYEADRAEKKLREMAYLMEGINRGKILVHQGYRYQKNKEAVNFIYWRCWKKICRAPLTTNLFDLDDRNPTINVLRVGGWVFPYDKRYCCLTRCMAHLKH